MISAYQKEQNDAKSRNSVPDEQHQYHSDGNPKHDKANQAFHKLLLWVFDNIICAN